MLGAVPGHFGPFVDRGLLPATVGSRGSSPVLCCLCVRVLCCVRGLF